MKRTFSFESTDEVTPSSGTALVIAGTMLIAVTYGLVRLAYGLYLPEMQADLGFDARMAGGISAGGSLAYVVGAASGFVLAAQHPRRLVLAAGASAAIGSAGMALAPQMGVFAVAAVVSSAGAGLASPALVQVLQRGLGSDRQASGQTVVNAGTGPGLVAAGVLAFVVLPHWRAAWLVAAVGAMVTAGLVLLLDRRIVGDVVEGTWEGRRTPDRRPMSGPTTLRAFVPPHSWFVAHRLVILAALLAGAASAAVWNYGRTLLMDTGVAPEISVWAWVCLGAGGTAVILTARLLSRLTPGVVWAITTAVMGLGTLALTLCSGDVPLALAACAAFGWAYTAATGALIAWTGTIDAERAASGTALLFVMLVLGQALGAVMIGSLVSSVGYGVAFSVAAGGAAVAAGLGTRRADRSSRCPHEPPIPRAEVISDDEDPALARKPLM